MQTKMRIKAASDRRFENPGDSSRSPSLSAKFGTLLPPFQAMDSCTTVLPFQALACTLDGSPLRRDGVSLRCAPAIALTLPAGLYESAAGTEEALAGPD
jgi:hypothetical protein